MSELKLGRRIVRAIVVLLLIAILVTVAPALNIRLPVTRVLSLILLALVVITPFLPARGRWEVRVYSGLLGLFVLAIVLAVLWARFW